MTLTLYGHPFSSYTAKVLTALYELDAPFTFRRFGPDDPDAAAEWASLAPLKRFPVLVDDGRPVFETSIIIEHLQARLPDAAPLIPAEPGAALEVRHMDRVFDGHVMTPMLNLAYDAGRAAEHRDPFGAARWREQLAAAYTWLDGVVADRTWAAGGGFSLADCAAAPALLYAHWAQPIGDDLAHLHALRRRLLERPSFARVVEEARPFRAHFPLGVPAED